MNYDITSAKTSHYFMPKPKNAFMGNQSEGATLKIIGNRLAGDYTTCGNGHGYLDWEYKSFGPVVTTLGPSYGFIKSRPHWAFTTKCYGLKAFGRLFLFGKSYNFASTKTGVRGYGIMMIAMKLKPVKEAYVEPVEVLLNLKEPIVLDPHLKS